jgi:hypothetical protein
MQQTKAAGGPITWTECSLFGPIIIIIIIIIIAGRNLAVCQSRNPRPKAYY